MEEVVEELKKKLGPGVIEGFKMREGRFIVVLDKGALLEAISWLFNEKKARLSTISVVDLGLDFEVLYHMTIKGSYVNLKVKVPKERPLLSSITSIVPGASMIEREVQDLFGVSFEGHPDPRRLTMPFEVSEEFKPMKGVMKGPVLEAQKSGIESVLVTGLRFPVTFASKRLRVKLGLKEVVKCTVVDQASLDETQALMRSFRFDEKVGFDWRRKKLRY